MLTEDERSTPQGIFNFAEDYLEGAHVLREHMRDGNHRREVIKFNLFHSVELYLKAYLRLKGVSIIDLRNQRKYGHSYDKLVPACESFGLTFPNSVRWDLQVAEKLNDPIEARYFRSVARPRIDHHGLYALALEVRKLIAPHFVCLSRPFEERI